MNFVANFIITTAAFVYVVSRGGSPWAIYISASLVMIQAFLVGRYAFPSKEVKDV